MKHKEGFEMKTSRLLISSAMLTAMSDQQALDNLKLLERFVTMCSRRNNGSMRWQL